MGKSSIGMVILGIIAPVSFGLNGYMFITNEILGTSDNQNIVVGFWDKLDENMDFIPYHYDNNFLLQFLDQKILNNNYVKLSNSDTTFTFLHLGMYKITCNILLNYNTEDNYYYIILKENTIDKETFFYHYAPTVSSISFHLTSSFYIFADLSSEYRIQAYSSLNAFSIGNALSGYNQLIIEYISS